MIDRWCFHVRGEAALAEQKLSLRRLQGLMCLVQLNRQ